MPEVSESSSVIQKSPFLIQSGSSEARMNANYCYMKSLNTYKGVYEKLFSGISLAPFTKPLQITTPPL